MKVLMKMLSLLLVVALMLSLVSCGTEEDVYERVEKYLAGEEIESGENMKGWCAILFEGAALGGGKASGGKIKNHYPKGLRTR